MADRIASDVPTPAMDRRWRYHFQTSDGIAATFRVVAIDLGSHLLAEVTPESELTEKGLVLPDGHDVRMFSVSDIGAINRDLTEYEARRHVGWQAYTGFDQCLLDEYVTKAFRRVRDGGGQAVAMPFNVYEITTLSIRPVTLNPVEEGAGISHKSISAYGSRLIGVR